MRRIFALIILTFILPSCKTMKSQDPPEGPVEDNTFQIKGKNQWTNENRNAFASFYYMVGEDKLLNGDFANAKIYMQTAYDLNPNPFLAAKLMEVDLLGGGSPKTVENAKRFVLLYPKSANIRALYGDVLVALNKLEEASREYSAAIDLGAQQDLAYMQILSIRLRQGQKEEAFKVVERWVRNVPQSANARFELAKVYLATKKNKQALEQARIAMQLEPNRPEIMLLTALAMEVNNESKQAVELYEKLYRMNSDNERLLIHMASLYKQIGEPKDALELLDEISRKSKKSRPDIALQKAIVLWEMGEMDKASKAFIYLYQKNPNSYRLKYLAGLAYENTEKYPQALELFEALEKSPQFFKPARIRRAVVLGKIKDHAKAIALIRDLQKVDTKSDPELFLLVAEFQSEMGRPQDSISTMKEAIKIQPDSLNFYFFLGVYQEKAGLIDDCVASMKKVISIDPKYSAAYNYIGYLYAESNQKLLEAKSLVEHALVLKPGDGLYLDSLGWIYFKLKDFNNALLYLNQALKAQPNEGVIVAHIGDVYAAMGQKNKALEHYKKALELKLDPDEKRKILTKYKNAGGHV